MAIACAGIVGNFSGRMPEQGKGDTEENHDDRGAEECDAGEIQKDADLQPQFGTSTARRGGRWRRFGSSIEDTERIAGGRALRGAGVGVCASSARRFVEREACRKLAGHLPTPVLGRLRDRRLKARL